MLYPLTFHPIFKERVWGGRKLEQRYRKPLPPNVPIGESWELSDRPGDVSVIANGPLAGKDLRWLMENHATELLGDNQPANGRFPLLLKILDAQEKLSVQVHPPAHKAAELGGEPKTEMWYVAEAGRGAELYVGLKKGVTRTEFEERIRSGKAAECLHRVPVKAGDTMFLPSGRVHAIGAGIVLFEIQQNSDTTYRVYDWDRGGLDGKPRPLHVSESLASINFDDFEPSLVDTRPGEKTARRIKSLVKDERFSVGIITFPLARSGMTETLSFPKGMLRVIGLLSGEAAIRHGKISVTLKPGNFCLLPAALDRPEIRFARGSKALIIAPGLRK